ncbi:MAG: acyl-CoA dehydrogenase, partial [Acidimicrobiales bacterium]|nr:acyl-CoA dehydrogenase [Acidimicrobiales bacterium]
MSDYTAPQRDIAFVLDHVVPIENLLKFDAYNHVDRDSVLGVLDEFGRFLSEVWAPTNVIGDETGSHVEGDEVVLAPELAAAYRAYMEAGWGGVAFDEAYGGGNFPWLVGIVQQELLNSANMALAMCPLLSQGAIDAIAHHGSEEQKETYLKHMVAGRWTGTMNLTEP